MSGWIAKPPALLQREQLCLSVFCGAVLGGHQVDAWAHQGPTVMSKGASWEESHVCVFL